MKTLSLATVFILAAGLCAGAAAQGGGQGRGSGIGDGTRMMAGRQSGGGMMINMLPDRYRGPNFYLRYRDELGLDAARVQKIKAVRMEMVKQFAQTESKLAVSRAELRDLLDSEAVDMTKVQAKVAEISGLRGDLINANFKAHVDATEVLSDEQCKKAMDIPRSRRNGGRSWQGRMSGQGRRMQSQN